MRETKKMHWKSHSSGLTVFSQRMYRQFTILLAASLLCLTTATGCALLRRGDRESRPARPDELAADTNATFRELWVNQRVTELEAQGLASTAARTRADSEFAERFPFAQPGSR